MIETESSKPSGGLWQAWLSLYWQSYVALKRGPYLLALLAWILTRALFFLPYFIHVVISFILRVPYNYFSYMGKTSVFLWPLFLIFAPYALILGYALSIILRFNVIFIAFQLWQFLAMRYSWNILGKPREEDLTKRRIKAFGEQPSSLSGTFPLKPERPLPVKTPKASQEKQIAPVLPGTQPQGRQTALVQEMNGKRI